MDSLIAIKGKDFVIVAADTTNAYSVLRMKVYDLRVRTMTIKFGIWMEKNCWHLEESILMCLSLETTFKRISLSNSIKMVINYQSTIQLNSSDMNSHRLSEKDLTASTVYSLDSKEINLDCIGLTIWDQWSN